MTKNSEKAMEKCEKMLPDGACGSGSDLIDQPELRLTRVRRSDHWTKAATKRSAFNLPYDHGRPKGVQL